MRPTPIANAAAHASSAGQPYILTLLLDKSTQTRLNALRTAHFPAHRNYLAAHVTLFHALPLLNLPQIKADLEHLCELTEPYDLIVGPVFPMSNTGVGVDVESRKGRTRNLRERLLKRWRATGVEMTNQDKHNLTRPHVTIQVSRLSVAWRVRRQRADLVCCATHRAEQGDGRGRQGHV